MPAEMLVRTSERADWMRCRQRWYWAWVDQLKPKQTAPALRFGSLVHKPLELYYIPQTTASWKKYGPKRGPDPAKTFLRLYDEEEQEMGRLGFSIDGELGREWADARDLGHEMLRGYIEKYGKDERYRVVAPEHPFQVDLHDESGLYICTYVGQLDVVVEDIKEQRFGFLDHKTAAAISTDRYSMDEQANSYWAVAPWVLPELGVHEEIDFIMFNILRKGHQDDRPTNELGQALNKNGTVSKRQPAPLFHRHVVLRGSYERPMVLNRIIEQAREMRRAKKGKLAIYKSPLNGCVGMFSCPYRDMCELHESGEDWESFRDGMMDVWEPYEAHEERTEDG